MHQKAPLVPEIIAQPARVVNTANIVVKMVEHVAFVNKFIYMVLSNILKIGMAVLLFLCIAPLPYGYYLFLRYAAMVIFTFLSLKTLHAGNSYEAILFFGLAMLFQPFIKVTLSKPLWNVVDVVVGVWLIWSVIQTTRSKKST